MKCGWLSLHIWRIYLAILTQISSHWETRQTPLKISWEFGRALYRREIFPTLRGFVTSVDVNAKDLLDIVSQHLEELASNFDYYLPEHEDPKNGKLWTNNPFVDAVSTCALHLYEEEGLLKLCCDTTLLSRYEKESLFQFWIPLATNMGFSVAKQSNF